VGKISHNILWKTVRLAVAPLSVSFLLFMAWVALYALPGAWLLIAVVGATSPKTAVWFFVVLCLVPVPLFWRRHWFSGITMLVGVIAIFFMAAEPKPADSFARKAANVVHVLAYRSALQRQVEELQRQGISPTVVAIPIDGFGSMANGIAFDPTGEILLPAEKRSKSWLAATRQTELDIEALEARHILGNYYSWFHY
jgi:hypothetical protein